MKRLRSVSASTKLLPWPNYFYPFVWGAVFLILELLNLWMSRRPFFKWVRDGDWRPLEALSPHLTVPTARRRLQS